MKDVDTVYDPAISVVIPTHNRCSLLLKTLDALAGQIFPFRQFEVVVVADHCTDSTVEMVCRYQAPFSLRILEHFGEGKAAAARNFGASQASGRILLFLDDDVEPTPYLLEAHMRAHLSAPGHAVIGTYPPCFPRANFALIQLYNWWDHLFQTMSQPGHRCRYTDVLSGNLSLEASLFHQVDGFDPVFHVHEDIELGIRLLKANIPLQIAPDAIGLHHDGSTLDRILKRKQLEGCDDVIIAQRYLDLFYTLPLSYFSHLVSICCLFAFRWSSVGDVVAYAVRMTLPLLEQMKVRSLWKSAYAGLQIYWYWRGVAETVGSPKAFRDLMHRAESLNIEVETVEIDLSAGLEAAEQQLDAQRPKSIFVRYGQQPIGFVSPQPGAEPLKGAHLRPLLFNQFAVSALEAMALDGTVLPASSQLQWFRVIRTRSFWFGMYDALKVWYEQYYQWSCVEQADDPVNWEDWRWMAAERARFLELQRATTSPLQPYGWRRQLYRLLYRMHEPLYHWYSARGWRWPSRLRQKTKQVLFPSQKSA